jgi:outer membrane immunogenic protein
MGMKAILTGVSVSLLAFGAANAADMGRGSLKDAPYSSTTFAWTGVYGGVTAGYGWGEADTFLDRGDNHGVASNSPGGGLIGLTAGYNWQWAPQWIVGIEGDFSYADISDRSKHLWDGHYWTGGWNSLATLRGRVGYSFGSTLVYATGGFAALDSSEYIMGDNDNDQSTDGRGWRTGWVVGAGIEHAFTDRISGKIEYLHAGFEDLSTSDGNGNPAGFGADLDLIRVGLNYKFH